MVLSYNDRFEVTWQDPEDANNCWLLDSVHWPLPQPRLSQDILTILVKRGIEWDVVWVNGYMYVRRLAPPPTPPEVLQRGPADVWFKDYQLLVRKINDEIRAADYGALTSEQLVAAIPELAAKTGDALLYTTVVVMEMWSRPGALLDFCEQELGEDGSGLAAPIMQGFTNQSAAAGEGLGRLAAVAERDPDLARALREGNIEAVSSLREHHPFQLQLDEYLHEYGGRLESWAHLHRPTWREQPELALKLIGRQLAAPGSSVSTSMQRSIEGRQRAQLEIQARLPTDKLAEFDALAASVSDYVTLSEDRAHWQLTVMGNLRIPVGILGGRLVTSGVIEQPNDIWYLSQEEIGVATSGTVQGYKDLISERKVEFERWGRTPAPAYVGAPPGPMPPEIEKLNVRFGGVGLPVVDAQTIKGQPASAGLARGPARVLRSLEESDRVEAGDILVCTMTSPSWTPLFMTAGGVVTDYGGVLSHSAICAREYGIPCVVATQVATSTIPDGAMISIDGSKGTVVIEGKA